MVSQLLRTRFIKTSALGFCALAALLALGACETNTESVYDQAPSASELSFNPESILRIADRLRETGDYMSALHMYRQVRERDPENVAALTGEGEILLTLGAYSEAEKRFRAAQNLGDASGRSAAGLGRALLRQNRPAEALPFFEGSLKEQDVTGRNYNGYGVTLDLLGRHDDAQIAYSQGLDRSPGNMILTNNLALSFALSEDYEAALRILSDLAGARPDAKGARENLALVYGLSGDMVAARNMSGIDYKGAELEARLDYIARIASMPVEARGPAIILGIEPETAVATEETEPEAEVTAEKSVEASESAEPLETAGSAMPADMEKTEPGTGSAAKRAPELATEPPFIVQLGAYLGEARARTGWKKLQAKATEELSGRNPAYETVTVEGREVVRLGTVVEGGYAAADALCASLKTVGVECLVRHFEKPESQDGGSGQSGDAL